MKSVLISIQPKWVEKIASGKKTIEVRKTRPKLETPFKCYIYQTKKFVQAEIGETNKYRPFLRQNQGKVIGEFVCDRIEEVYQCNSGWVQENACISKGEFFDYLGIPRNTHFGYDKKAYGWHISALKIYDKPKELSEFKTVDIQAVRKCERREQSYFDGYCNNGGYLKNGFYCSEKDDWCDKCKTKPLERPPQSWCYVESLGE